MGSRLVRAAHLSAAQALFDADPDGAVKDLFASRVFEALKDPDAMIRVAAGGATRVLFRRFQPERHENIFNTMLAKLPPVVEVDQKQEGDGGEGGGGGDRVTASELAYAKLAAGLRFTDNKIG